MSNEAVNCRNTNGGSNSNVSPPPTGASSPVWWMETKQMTVLAIPKHYCVMWILLAIGSCDVLHLTEPQHGGSFRVYNWESCSQHMYIFISLVSILYKRHVGTASVGCRELLQGEVVVHTRFCHCGSVGPSIQHHCCGVTGVDHFMGQ